MKISIRSKLLLYFSFFVILILCLQMIFNFLLTSNVFINQKKKIVEDAFYQIKEVYNDDLSETEKIIKKYRRNDKIKVILTSNKKIIYSIGFHNKSNVYSKASKASFTPKAVETNNKYIYNPKTTLRLNGKFIYNNEEIHCFIKLSVMPIDSSFDLFTKSNLYITPLVLILGIFISHVFSKKLSFPIESIEKVSKKISNLDFSSKANEDIAVKELFSLAQNINMMSEELQKYIKVLEQDLDQQKQFELLRRNFISAISHEMKTPLGLLQVYSENLRNNVANIDKDYYCEIILEETSKLSNMVSQMLTTSSLSSDFINIDLKELSLSDLCEKVVLMYEPMFADYDFKCNIKKDIHISGDHKYIEQVLKNIINNAMQNTTAGSKIQLTLERNENYANISIFNQGKYIDEDDLKFVWEAFYRTDQSRKHTEYNNVGLGLYLVKTIVDKHHGKYNISNTEGGVRVDISFLIHE